MVNGRLDMESGDIAGNRIAWDHRYSMSFINGSAGIFVGAQGVLNKTGGLIYGTDAEDTLQNQCISLKLRSGEAERGSVTVGATAYYSRENICVNSSF
jgi:hypothetical protein